MMSGPSSPDFNPMDYQVWYDVGVLSQAAIEANDSSQFKNALQLISFALSVKAIDNSVKDYHKRLQACVSQTADIVNV